MFRCGKTLAAISAMVAAGRRDIATARLFFVRPSAVRGRLLRAIVSPSS
jgi:hypothetical protein